MLSSLKPKGGHGLVDSELDFKPSGHTNFDLRSLPFLLSNCKVPQMTKFKRLSNGSIISLLV